MPGGEGACKAQQLEADLWVRGEHLWTPVSTCGRLWTPVDAFATLCNVAQEPETDRWTRWVPANACKRL